MEKYVKKEENFFKTKKIDFAERIKGSLNICWADAVLTVRYHC
jgi:hypothetical protein